MNNLILVRHGQSLWNKERRFTGWADIDFTEQGKLEAKQAGRLIKNLNIKFDERKKSFEKKFVRDEELQFKIAAKRNKYLGQWVAKKLGYNSEQEKEYIVSVIKADFQEAGDEDVFRKIKIDLKDQNVSDDDIRKKMEEFNEKAKSEFI